MTEPLASWEFNSPKEKLVKSPAVDRDPVPPLVHWNRKYSNDEDERQGFRKTTAIGEYHISPVKTKSGLHVGYHLMFANNGKSKLHTEGLWTDLGVFSHPGMAVARAKKHYDKHSAGVKLNECDCSPSVKGKRKKRRSKNESVIRVANILSARLVNN